MLFKIIRNIRCLYIIGDSAADVVKLGDHAPFKDIWDTFQSVRTCAAHAL